MFGKSAKQEQFLFLPLLEIKRILWYYSLANILPLGTYLQNNLAVSRLIWQAALSRGLRTASRGCCELDNLVHSVSHVCEPL